MASYPANKSENDRLLKLLRVHQGSSAFHSLWWELTGPNTLVLCNGCLPFNNPTLLTKRVCAKNGLDLYCCIIDFGKKQAIFGVLLALMNKGFLRSPWLLLRNYFVYVKMQQFWGGRLRCWSANTGAMKSMFKEICNEETTALKICSVIWRKTEMWPFLFSYSHIRC